MTRAATDDECSALQAHAIATGNAHLRWVAWAALGYETRIAMMPCTSDEIQEARIGVTDQLEMLRLQGATLRTLGGDR